MHLQQKYDLWHALQKGEADWPCPHGRAVSLQTLRGDSDGKRRPRGGWRQLGGPNYFFGATQLRNVTLLGGALVRLKSFSTTYTNTEFSMSTAL